MAIPTPRTNKIRPYREGLIAAAGILIAAWCCIWLIYTQSRVHFSKASKQLTELSRNYATLYDSHGNKIGDTGVGMAVNELGERVGSLRKGAYSAAALAFLFSAFIGTILIRSRLRALAFEQHEKQAAEEVHRVNRQLKQQNAALLEIEKKLRQQEAESSKLALIAAHTGHAVTLTDADGHVEWVNEGFTKLTGHTFEEVRGKKPGAVLQGADTDMKTVQFMHDQLQKGEAFSVEILNYSKTGAKHWIALEVQPIRDEHGTIRNYMGIKIDITKRKLLEHRLSLYNAISKIFGSAETLEGGMRKILQTIVENEGWQLGAIWNVDRPTNTLYCAEVWSSPNISIPQFTDVLRKMHLSQGVGLAGRVWAESEPVWICDILKEPDMPNAEGAEKDGLRSAIGFPIRINGRFWGVMEFMAANIDKPDSNLLHMFESLGRQCSQFIIRKIAEADLLETNTLQKAILDSANFSIISTDEHGMIRSFNAEAEQMLGYSSDEVVGKFTPELFHDKDEIVREASAASTELGKTIEPGFEAFIARARQKIVDEREWIYIHKSGGRVPVLLSVSALRTAAGTITGFVGIAADITQRKKNEEELRSSLAEVERFNKLMFTRELRVIELKEEVNELRKQHGEALLYTSVETETR